MVRHVSVIFDGSVWLYFLILVTPSSLGHATPSLLQTSFLAYVAISSLHSPAKTLVSAMLTMWGTILGSDVCGTAYVGNIACYVPVGAPERGTRDAERGTPCTTQLGRHSRKY